jgi:hypothetical protein
MQPLRAAGADLRSANEWRNIEIPNRRRNAHDHIHNVLFELENGTLVQSSRLFATLRATVHVPTTWTEWREWHNIMVLNLLVTNNLALFARSSVGTALRTSPELALHQPGFAAISLHWYVLVPIAARRCEALLAPMAKRGVLTLRVRTLAGCHESRCAERRTGSTRKRRERVATEIRPNITAPYTLASAPTFLIPRFKDRGSFRPGYPDGQLFLDFG